MGMIRIHIWEWFSFTYVNDSHLQMRMILIRIARYALNNSRQCPYADFCRCVPGTQMRMRIIRVTIRIWAPSRVRGCPVEQAWSIGICTYIPILPLWYYSSTNRIHTAEMSRKGCIYCRKVRSGFLTNHYKQQSDAPTSISDMCAKQNKLVD